MEWKGREGPARESSFCSWPKQDKKLRTKKRVVLHLLEAVHLCWRCNQNMEGSQQPPPPWIGTYIPTYHLVVSCVGPTYLPTFLLHNPFVSFHPFLKSRQTLDDWVQNKTRFDLFIIFVIIEWQFVYYFPLPNYYTIFVIIEWQFVYYFPLPNYYMFVHFDTCLLNNWLILRILFWRMIFSQIFHQIFFLLLQKNYCCKKKYF
jgi:hypothetical protein